MKKMIVGLSLLAASSMVFAQTALTNDATTGIASVDLTNTLCPLVATGETAKIRGSKDVKISYACDASAAGLGTAHPQGKGCSFGASSNGGALAKVCNTAGKFNDAAAAGTAAGTAATTAKTAGSSS